VRIVLAIMGDPDPGEKVMVKVALHELLGGGLGFGLFTGLQPLDKTGKAAFLTREIITIKLVSTHEEKAERLFFMALLHSLPHGQGIAVAEGVWIREAVAGAKGDAGLLVWGGLSREEETPLAVSADVFEQLGAAFDRIGNGFSLGVLKSRKGNLTAPDAAFVMHGESNLLHGDPLPVHDPDGCFTMRDPDDHRVIGLLLPTVPFIAQNWAKKYIMVRHKNKAVLVKPYFYTLGQWHNPSKNYWDDIKRSAWEARRFLGDVYLPGVR
jgi:hypothetical protein